MSLYSHLGVVGVTPADQAAVRAVELGPGAVTLVTPGTSPARGTRAPADNDISIFERKGRGGEGSPSIHRVAARSVLTATVLLTALAVSPVWTLLLTLNRENIIMCAQKIITTLGAVWTQPHSLTLAPLKPGRQWHLPVTWSHTAPL